MCKTPSGVCIFSISPHDFSISHFLLSYQYLVILLCCLPCVNFMYLKWTTGHDYCPEGVYMVLILLLCLAQFFIKISCLNDWLTISFSLQVPLIWLLFQESECQRSLIFRNVTEPVCFTTNLPIPMIAGSHPDTK